MNEAETRAELIDPALKAAGWGVVEASRVRREVITLGRLQGAGKRTAQDIADYVLTYRNHKLAVIEAKRRELPDRGGRSYGAVGKGRHHPGRKPLTDYPHAADRRP
jgi:type I restriction enzyme, R subunit